MSPKGQGRQALPGELARITENRKVSQQVLGGEGERGETEAQALEDGDQEPHPNLPLGPEMMVYVQINRGK